MGLDMYLNARRSLSSWDKDNTLHTEFNQLAKNLGFDMEIQEIGFNAIYWRKANAIHNWFVKNVQHGVDDCGTYEVSDIVLNELLILIDTVLEDTTKAPDLIPPTDGFFFGGTQLDAYYFDELRRTKEEVSRLLDIIGKDADWDWTLEYRSSW